MNRFNGALTKLLGSGWFRLGIILSAFWVVIALTCYSTSLGIHTLTSTQSMTETLPAPIRAWWRTSYSLDLDLFKVTWLSNDKSVVLFEASEPGRWGFILIPLFVGWAAGCALSRVGWAPRAHQ
jgi:hypothetical protein